MDDFRIIAVIPTLGRNPERLSAAINSIKQFTHQEFRLIVIDNSYEANLRLEAEGVEIVHMGVNVGWVGALEYVRRNFDFDYLWSIQDDMTLLNDVLTVPSREMAGNSRLGAITPLALRDGLLHGRT
jgi:GT2 family glycosyltransferase